MAQEPVVRAAFRLRSAEIGIALVFLVFAGLIIFDSIRQGARWLAEGPQPGYFPFYLGVLICAASLVTLVRALLMPAEQNRTFVQVGQFKLVLSVLVPSAVYVALVGWIGIYVSAVLFVALFMRWLGKYPWWKVATVSIGHSVALFVIFEVWFLVPLPKGPLERLLGVG
ncbi:MAG: tripartite tricarboxylate transporter TctB family protein [Betaproteobacteria bacterium]|nr:tripartite tricarboxylate transporter TctB family protein [Betaproteobacteria bacterium]MDH4323950.1 tripartite tricarboxylate transporter TctB family protein [Betaproteobacteria bacterium]